MKTSSLIAAGLLQVALFVTSPASAADRPAKVGPVERHFVFLCEDGPLATERRKQNLAAHLAYVESAYDAIIVAGPVFDETGQRLVGSLYVIRAKDADAAWRILAADPNYAGGVWVTVRQQQFLPAIGKWIGGKTW